MENKDYVSYELALALKKCGFDEPCEAFYEHIDGKMYFSVDCNEDWNSGVDYSAPSLYHVQKWLREKKEIFVEVTSEALHDWDFFVMELDEDANVGVVRGSEIYPSYESALSAGISAALTSFFKPSTNPITTAMIKTYTFLSAILADKPLAVKDGTASVTVAQLDAIEDALAEKDRLCMERYGIQLYK